MRAYFDGPNEMAPPHGQGYNILFGDGHVTVVKRNEYLFPPLQETLRRSVAIVRTVLNPGGINLGMNLGKCAGAGVEDHLHWHLVPRWEGDTNFMPVIGETRVMPQHLLDSYDRLKPHFESLAG
jgi:ATP adenylyltransferase